MKNTKNTRNIGNDTAVNIIEDSYRLSEQTARTIDNIRTISQVVEDTMAMMEDEYGEAAAERDIAPIQKAADELIQQLFRYANANTLMLLSFKDNTNAGIVKV